MAVNIPGIIAVAVFYVAILVTGIVAGRRTSKSKSNESIMVADRGLGMFVSILTICATMVGGGFLNGSAESMAKSGMLHTQAPIGYPLGFLFAGVFFGKKMRENNYVTMFDPFQLKYGKKVGALLFIPHFFGDLFWSAAVLAALGATIAIILDINAKLSICISAAIAIIYTTLGGLYAVAYTDVIQLGFIFVGLTVAFPFALTSDAVDLSRIKDTWAGEVPTETIGSYIDHWCLFLGGGIPWQALYQRILACKTPSMALWSTIWGSLISIVLVLPAIVFGVAGAAADWNATAYGGEVPLPDDMYTFILPLGLSYLCPLPVSIVGIGAIAAAVMSSADSCILSTSSIITKNIYNDIFRPHASEKEMFWVLRITIVLVGIMGTLVAAFSTSVYGLFTLCGDLMYVILFPQLFIVMYWDATNAYGAVGGFFSSLILRLLVGEPLIGLPTAIQFPLYNAEKNVQNFPVRTLCMLVGVFFQVSGSILTNYLFKNDIIPARYDVLKCREHRTIYFKDQPSGDNVVVEADPMSQKSAMYITNGSPSETSNGNELQKYPNVTGDSQGYTNKGADMKDDPGVYVERL